MRSYGKKGKPTLFTVRRVERSDDVHSGPFLYAAASSGPGIAANAPTSIGSPLRYRATASGADACVPPGSVRIATLHVSILLTRSCNASLQPMKCSERGGEIFRSLDCSPVSAGCRPQETGERKAYHLSSISSSLRPCVAAVNGRSAMCAPPPITSDERAMIGSGNYGLAQLRSGDRTGRRSNFRPGIP